MNTKELFEQLNEWIGTLITDCGEGASPIMEHHAEQEKKLMPLLKKVLELEPWSQIKPLVQIEKRKLLKEIIWEQHRMHTLYAFEACDLPKDLVEPERKEALAFLEASEKFVMDWRKTKESEEKTEKQMNPIEEK